MEGTIGQILFFASNFAPRNWAFCAGQILSIAQNTALFSILGTTYGGDGRVTFGLPDFRGRIPIGTGQGPGLAPQQLGEVAGSPTHTLIITEMPAHSHPTTLSVPVSSGNAPVGGESPAGHVLATPTGGAIDSIYTAPASSTGNMGGVSVSMSTIAGSSQPVSNQQPYLGMNFVICMSGVFPARN